MFNRIKMIRLKQVNDTIMMQISPKQKIKLLKHHLKLFEKLWGTSKNFDEIKKFFKIYVSDWPGAKELRAELMAVKNSRQVVDILSKKSWYSS